MAIIAAISLQSVINISYVALGLGLVIFFHEFGHFAVAKWCNVCVERFSIGFGPILWSRKWGETEYAFSAIPFGGYVKMLGQDDMDPSQLSSDEIAEDPRAYSAKTVLQRMAIISAGVIMNVITGMMFFACAFGMGVVTTPAVLGEVQTGYPAWEAGIEAGDQLTRINDRDVTSFGDIMRGIALTTGAVKIEGVHRDGKTYEVTVIPNDRGTRRIIGAGPARSLKLITPPDESIPLIMPGSSAVAVQDEFQPGDVIVKAGDTSVSTFAELRDVLAAERGQPLKFSVQRNGELQSEPIAVGPTAFRSLGLTMDIGRIAVVQKNSVADKADLRVGDRITKVDNQVVGTHLNPLQLPGFLADKAGDEIVLEVERQVDDETTKEEIVVTPAAKPGWLERPLSEGIPLSVPALGIAYHVIPTVLNVEEGSPAEIAKILPGERVKQITLTLPEGEKADYYSDREIVIDFDKKDDADELINNWAYAFWKLQELPTRRLRLTVTDKLGKPRIVDINPRNAEDWYVPNTRGIRFEGLAQTQRADSFPAAVGMGFTHTRNSITDIYLTLKNLFRGDLSVKELHGPIGIATVAYRIAREGFSEFVLFLGFLSVNLAVLNFLPIPVLDGGHMVFLIWEGVTRRKPSEKVLVAATYFGMAFVLGLMLLVIYLDLFVHGVGM